MYFICPKDGCDIWPCVHVLEMPIWIFPVPIFARIGFYYYFCHDHGIVVWREDGADLKSGRSAGRGALTVVRAEIIPVTPDADNAAGGTATIRLSVSVNYRMPMR